MKKPAPVREDDIHLFEEHSSTLPIWWARQGVPQTVVYLDAHLDLQKCADDALSALKACTTLDEVRALEAPHHLNPSTRYAYGIENFLYGAHRLGLINRLIWVAPPHISRHYSTSLLDYVQQMDGISFDELTSFTKLGANSLRGTLLGLDITICDYDDLGSADVGEDFYLDIDIDFFIEVPADRLWIDPAIVINEVLAQSGKPTLVTISRAVNSGFTPLAFRYIGDYIYSLLARCDIEFDYYQRLTSAIFDLGYGKLEYGRSVCRQLIDAQPKLAAAYYILALVTAEATEKNSLLATARNHDAAYDFDFACEAMGLLHRKKTLNHDTLNALATMLERLDLVNPQREQAEIALAQVFATGGNLPYAQSLLAQQTGVYANHEDVLLLITARQLQDSGMRKQNREMLRIVSRGVKNVSAAQLYLGDLAFADKNYRVALEHFLLAQNSAPAWMLPLQRMLASYRQLGLDDKADGVERLIGQRQQRLQELIE